MKVMQEHGDQSFGDKGWPWWMAVDGGIGELWEVRYLRYSGRDGSP
jgi:hypothetical protein